MPKFQKIHVHALIELCLQQKYANAINFSNAESTAMRFVQWFSQLKSGYISRIARKKLYRKELFEDFL